MPRRVRLRPVLAGVLASVAASGGLVATATPARATQNWAELTRSTEFSVHNRSTCTFLRKQDSKDKEMPKGRRLNHGKWIVTPPDRIDSAGNSGAGRAFWKSRSQGMFGGTEGRVVYVAVGCGDADKELRIHWKNPFWGRGRFDVGDSDPRFRITTSGGRGHHARIELIIDSAFAS